MIWRICGSISCIWASKIVFIPNRHETQGGMLSTYETTWRWQRGNSGVQSCTELLPTEVHVVLHLELLSDASEIACIALKVRTTTKNTFSFYFDQIFFHWVKFILLARWQVVPSARRMIHYWTENVCHW